MTIQASEQRCLSLPSGPSLAPRAGVRGDGAALNCYEIEIFELDHLGWNITENRKGRNSTAKLGDQD